MSEAVENATENTAVAEKQEETKAETSISLLEKISKIIYNGSV